MFKEKPQTFSSVLSVNPYNDTYFSGTPSRIDVDDTPDYDKQQYAISYLNTNDFITATISISKNIPEEDLHDAIENKTYEELALDMAIEYTIQYIESQNNIDENNRSFIVFVVDPLIIEETFPTVIEKVKYLDYIIPVPLLLKGLYQKEIIDNSGIHCFIYFQQNDAFFTIYNDEEFIYTKSLKYSFNVMHERFCELLGEQVSYETFTDIISDEGLGTDNPEYQKYLIKMFGEVFLHTNDILTYAKRAYEIEKIDQVYVGTQIGTIPGLDEYCQTYLGLNSTSFSFDYGFESDAFYVDQVHALMHLYTTLDLEERYDANFTIFHRPPPFVQRDSGKLILLGAGGVVAAAIYPLILFFIGLYNNIDASFLNDTYTEVHNKKVTREATIKLKLTNKKAVEKRLAQQKNEFNEKKSVMAKIYDVKVNYPMKAKTLVEYAKLFNRFKVKMSRVSFTTDEKQKRKSYAFELEAYRDTYITNLLEYITKNKTDKYQFLLQKIAYNAESKKYTSELKVVLR